MGQETSTVEKETKEEELQSLSRRRTKFKEEREEEMPQQTEEELGRDRGKEGDFEKKAKRRAEREGYVQRATSKRWNKFAGRESQRAQTH